MTDAPARRGPAGAITVAVLAAAAFALHLWNAQRLLAAGALDPRQIDFLFDADAGFRMEWFANGRWNNVDVRHTLFSVVTVLPVRGAARALCGLGVLDGPEPAARAALALLVGPLAGALRAAFCYGLARRLGLDVARAALVAAADQVTFASILFSALPEHFPISAAVLAGALWWVAGLARAGRAPTVLATAAVTFVVAGVTVTNVVPVVVCAIVAASAAGMGFVRAKGRASAGAAVGLLLLWALVLGLRGSRTQAQFEGASDFAGSYVTADPAARAARVPAALRNSVVAGEPAPQAGRLAERAGAPMPWVWTFETERSPWARAGLAGAALAVLAALGAARLLRSGGVLRTVGIAAAVQVAFHAVFHAVWGSPEVFLYAAHWAPALTVLAAGLATGRGAGRVTDAVLAVVVAGLAWANLGALAGMLAAMRG